MKMAILCIHPAIFRELLQLPDDAVIRNIHVPHDRYGVLEVTIEGAGWETAEGQVLMSTTGQIVDNKIDWGF